MLDTMVASASTCFIKKLGAEVGNDFSFLSLGMVLYYGIHLVLHVKCAYALEGLPYLSKYLEPTIPQQKYERLSRGLTG